MPLRADVKKSRNKGGGKLRTAAKSKPKSSKAPEPASEPLPPVQQPIPMVPQPFEYVRALARIPGLRKGMQ